MNTKPIHHQLDRMHEATMHGSIAPVDIYWLISEHRQLVNEHDQTVLKLAVAETEAANLRRQLDAAPMYRHADGSPRIGPSGKYGWCWQLPRPAWAWNELDNIRPRTMRMF